VGRGKSCHYIDVPEKNKPGSDLLLKRDSRGKKPLKYRKGKALFPADDATEDYDIGAARSGVASTGVGKRGAGRQRCCLLRGTECREIGSVGMRQRGGMERSLLEGYDKRPYLVKQNFR